MSRFFFPSLGDRVRVVRRSLKLSQAEFAKKLKVSRSYVGQVETHKEPASRKFLEAVHREFEVSIDWLLEGKGEAYTDSLKQLEIGMKLSGKRQQAFFQKARRAIEFYDKLFNCLGSDIFRLEDDSIQPGDQEVIKIIGKIHYTLIMNERIDDPFYDVVDEILDKELGPLKIIKRNPKKRRKEKLEGKGE